MAPPHPALRPGLKNAEYISFGGKNAPEAKTQLNAGYPL
jgi:hypothetical protein